MYLNHPRILLRIVNNSVQIARSSSKKMGLKFWDQRVSPNEIYKTLIEDLKIIVNSFVSWEGFEKKSLVTEGSSETTVSELRYAFDIDHKGHLMTEEAILDLLDACLEFLEDPDSKILRHVYQGNKQEYLKAADEYVLLFF